jgi:hypothetical protein
MRKMNARHEYLYSNHINLHELVIAAEQKLARSVCRNDKTYSEFLKKLILEGLIRLLEPVVYVRYIWYDVAASRRTKN